MWRAKKYRKIREMLNLIKKYELIKTQIEKRKMSRHTVRTCGCYQKGIIKKYLQRCSAGCAQIGHRNCRDRQCGESKIRELRGNEI